MNKLGKARDVPLAWTWYFFISSPLSSLSFPQRLVLIGDPSYCSCILQHPHQPAYFRDLDTHSESKLRTQIESSPQLITLMRPSISTRTWQVGVSVANTVHASRPESMPFLLKRNHARYLFSVLLSAMTKRSWFCRLKVDFFQLFFQLGRIAREGRVWNYLGGLHQSYFWTGLHHAGPICRVWRDTHRRRYWRHKPVSALSSWVEHAHSQVGTLLHFSKHLVS